MKPYPLFVVLLIGVLAGLGFSRLGTSSEQRIDGLSELVVRCSDGSRIEIRDGQINFWTKEGVRRVSTGILGPDLAGTEVDATDGSRRLYFAGVSGGNVPSTVYRSVAGDGINIGFFEKPGVFGVGYVYGAAET